MSIASSTASSTDFKERIIDALTTFRDHDKTVAGATFKVLSYNKALKAIATLGPITSMRSLDGVEGLPKGKDSAILRKIAEVIETGVCASAEAIKATPSRPPYWDAYEVFLGIYGVGPAKAHELAAEQGLKSISDLRAAIAGTPKLLNGKQTIGLRYYEDLMTRIPRDEMLVHEALLTKAIPDVPFCIAGSFRRKEPTSGDIDVLLCHSDPAILRRIVETLGPYIDEQLAMGDHKFMGICHLPTGAHRRIDIVLTPPEEYAFAILYFTGSMQFNIEVRRRALTLGYSLNEHGFTPPSAPLRTEEDILDFLGIAYVPPEERNSSPHLRFTNRHYYRPEPNRFVEVSGKRILVIPKFQQQEIKGVKYFSLWSHDGKVVLLDEPQEISRRDTPQIQELAKIVGVDTSLKRKDLIAAVARLIVWE